MAFESDQSAIKVLLGFGLVPKTWLRHCTMVIGLGACYRSELLMEYCFVDDGKEMVKFATFGKCGG